MSEERLWKIYCHTNKINGKKYIGITKKERLNDRWVSGKGYKSNRHFYQAIQKYGWDNFIHEVLFDNLTESEGYALEEKLILLNKTYIRDFGYNLAIGDSHTPPTQETKALISKNHADFSLSKNPASRKIICLNTLKVFATILEGSIEYGINKSGISMCCLNYRKFAGNLDGERLVWMYYEDYANLDKNAIPNIIKLAQISNKGIKKIRKVICITTNKVFNKVTDASNYYNINSTSQLSRCCQGKRNWCGKLEDGTKLKWMYYDDYIKERGGI